jgi:HPt (histidine-containing phosphotransfer) domain-containing protein
MSADEDETAAMIAEIWQRMRPIALERVDVLEAAADAVAGGTLGEAERSEAESCAHKLAGSLGLYGFDRGSSVARVIEGILKEGAPPEPGPPRLRSAVAELRAALEPTAG